MIEHYGSYLKTKFSENIDMVTMDTNSEKGFSYWLALMSACLMFLIFPSLCCELHLTLRLLQIHHSELSYIIHKGTRAEHIATEARQR